MSNSMSEVLNKRWTALRKTSLVMSILKGQGQISTSSAARERVKDMFSHQKNFKEYSQLYEIYLKGNTHKK